MAQKGAVGHFALDFMCFYNCSNDMWDIYAVEINLRITATTHPMMTLRLLTHGELDQNTGLFYTEGGNGPGSKHYIASDNSMFC